MTPEERAKQRTDDLDRTMTWFESFPERKRLTIVRDMFNYLRVSQIIGIPSVEQSVATAKETGEPLIECQAPYLFSDGEPIG